MFSLLCVVQTTQAAVKGEWQRFSQGNIPPQAILVDAEQTAEQAWYLCRASYNKGVHPGKLNAALGGCLITSAGRANRSVHYEVLLNHANYVWEKYRGDTIPENAVQGGTDDAGENYILYICRAKFQGRYQAGKILKPARGCKIADAERERTAWDFELLLQQDTAPDEQRVFNAPRHQQQHLDNCRLPDTDCGERTASAWCQTQAYARAVQWTGITHPLGIKTIYIGDASLCEGTQKPCNGFVSITCTGALAADSLEKKPLNVSGRWQTQRGAESRLLHLAQDGEQVTGQFENSVQGSLRGFLNDRQLWGRWTEQDGRTGRFQWTLTPDGQSFQGINEEQHADSHQQERWQGNHLP